MKIAHITTYTSGGAGIAALRLHRELLQQGVESKLLCLKKECSHVPEVYLFADKSIFRKLLSKIGVWPMLRHRQHKTMMQLRKKAHASFYYSFPNTEYDILSHPLVQEADIIHLHWIAGFVDYRSFFKNVQKPVVWTFHDYNPMLGGLHSPIKGLEAVLAAYEEVIVKEKRDSYRLVRDLTIVCISSQIKQMVEDYTPLRHTFKCLIHNGVEPAIFYPKQTRGEIRDLYHIDPETNILLFISYTLCNELKGYHLMIEAYESLRDENCLLFLIGDLMPGERIVCQKPYIHSHALADPSSLADYYAAADLFVMPSLFETFAQTPIEALMCGCPTVMTPVSGSDDIINDHNGMIAADYTAEAIGQAIEESLLRDFDRSQIAAETATRFAIGEITNQTIDLYRGILSKDNV